MLSKRILIYFVLSLGSLFLTAGCVDQNPDVSKLETSSNVYANNTDEELKLIATSFSAVTICDMLEIPLIGVPETANNMPERYKDATIIGTSMSPDFEIIASLKPTQVIGPDTLESDIKPKLDAVNLNNLFLNLRSVEGLYESISILGDKYNASEKADEINSDFQNTINEFEKEREGKENPTVLILMGFPGSFCEATSTSYVGNLVELAGGVNIVIDDSDDFVSWNTEELVKLNPDYILWTAHAIPDLVGDMFEKEFATNDIWKHFTAVQEGRVIELESSLFHMSANFGWVEAVEFLQELFYGV